MKSHQLRRIPVIAEDNHIVGIVSQGDLALRIDDPEATSEVVEDISKPSSPHSWKQTKSEIQSRWNRITEDDLDGSLDYRETLILRLMQRYAMHRNEAEREVDQFWEDLTTTTTSQ
jgi:hypothetical protein